jgi:hypothetical protein
LPRTIRAAAGLLVESRVKIPSTFNAYFSDHYRLHQQEVHLLESVRLYLLNEKTFPMC